MLNVIKKELQGILEYYKDYICDEDEVMNNIIKKEINTLIEEYELSYKCVSVMINETDYKKTIINIERRS